MSNSVLRATADVKALRWRDATYLCMACGSLFFFNDAIKAHRMNQWIGGTPSQWFFAAAGYALYVLGFLVAAWILCRIAKALQRHDQLSVTWAIIGVLTMSPIWAAALYWGAPSYRIEFAIALPVLTTLLVGGALLLHRFRVLTIRTSAAIIVVSVVAGLWMAHSAGHRHFLSFDRADLMTQAAAVWAAFAALAMLAACFLPSKARTAVRLLLALTLVMGPLGWQGYTPELPGAAVEREPGILLVTCDALRADYCSTYGGPAETEAFDQLAAAGTVFERAYTLAPWTLASTAAMYSSQYPPSLTPGAEEKQWRVERSLYRVGSEQETLAQRLKKKGYVTGLFTGNPLVCQGKQDIRGFDYVMRLPVEAPGITSAWAYVPYLRELTAQLSWTIALEQPYDSTRVLTAYTQRFMRQFRDRNVFLWVHYMDPHSPYFPPDRYRTLTHPWQLVAPIEPHWGVPQMDTSHMLPFTPNEQAYTLSLYEGEITYVADSIGLVLNELKSQGWTDNNYVCLTSDHGEEFWDHGRWGHGHTLYDESIRVPWIIAGPGIVKQRVDEPVSHIDMIPTLADLAGAGHDAQWLGKSLRPVLESETINPSQSYVYSQATFSGPNGPLQMAVRDNWKYVRRLEGGQSLFFNLATDPRENNDLSDDIPQPMKSIAQDLTEWSASWPFTFTLMSGGEMPEADEEVLEQLQAIGYLD
jgi:arylsulfatase A-like enzyme